MDRYYDFTVEDFVWDDFFRQWVLFPTRETESLWQDWIGGNPEIDEKIQQARAIVLSLRLHEPEISDPEITRIVKQTINRISEAKESVEVIKPVPFYRAVWFRVAASVLFLITAGWAIYNFKVGEKPASIAEIISIPVPAEAQTEQVNKTNKPLLVSLADGSKVTLAPAGGIRYGSKLTDRREVYLEGEAFFDIAKDAARPFFVHANGLVTKVLGTSFTIKAYQNSNEVTVEVKTGRVSVFPESDPAAKEKLANADLQGVVLRPNQKIIYSREKVRMVKTLVEKPEMVVAKAEIPEFEFEDTPVSEVFDKIAKAYGIDLLYDEEVLRGCPLTATLDNLTLHDKLSIICKAVEASYEIIDGQIIIHSKGCKN